MHCSVQSPRTALECRAMTRDQGPGARVKRPIRHLVRGSPIPCPLSCSPQFGMTMTVEPAVECLEKPRQSPKVPDAGVRVILYETPRSGGELSRHDRCTAVVLQDHHLQ